MPRVLKPFILATLIAATVPTAAQQPAEQNIPAKVRLFIPFKDYTAEENQRVLALYKWLRVADVSDGMDVVGLQDVGTVAPEIHALWKDTQTFSHRVVGIAVTARYVPTNRREPRMDADHRPLVRHHHLGSLPGRAAAGLDAGHRRHRGR
jgi:hypothetical protein